MPAQALPGKAPGRLHRVPWTLRTMRDHLATLLYDFRRHSSEVAVVRYQGNRRRVTTYGEIARLAGRFAALLV